MKLPSFDYRKWYEKEINTIEDIEKYLLNSQFKNGLYFRGMSKYEYICISSYYRYYLSKYSDTKWEMTTIGYGDELSLPKIDKELYKKHSFEILDTFKGFLTSYGVRNLEFSSLMYLTQHYGLPTNLIDFTIDPKIALYFACERDSEDCNVYMYDIYSHIRGLSQALVYNSPYRYEDKEKEVESIYKSYTTFNNKYISDIATPDISDEDVIYNQRIKNQNGVFVYHCEATPFDNLMYINSSDTGYDGRKIFKINGSLKQEVLTLLDKKYGINKDYLYPKELEDKYKSQIEQAVLDTKKMLNIPNIY